MNKSVLLGCMAAAILCMSACGKPDEAPSVVPSLVSTVSADEVSVLSEEPTSSDQVSVTVSEEEVSSSGTSQQGNTSQAEQPSAFVVYEGIFLDNEAISAAFEQVRGEAPYQQVTKDYHVTTTFFPEKVAGDLYGKEVEVNIIGYKAGAVDTDGGTTYNEGFKVELHTDDKDMAAYLESHARNFHITGSFAANPGYTEYMDFSDAEPLDITVKGTFGAYLDDDIIILTAADVERLLK